MEPDSSDPASILWDGGLSSGESSIAQKESSISSRMKKRKKFFNQLAAKKDEHPKFSTEHTYTFEVSEPTCYSVYGERRGFSKTVSSAVLPTHA